MREIKVKINNKIKQQLDINIDVDEVIISRGLEHAIKYISYIENIIETPDYVGINPREKGVSLECIKLFEDNILLAIKLDMKNNYFYTASMYDITDAKLKSMIRSGRIKKYNNCARYFISSF